MSGKIIDVAAGLVFHAGQLLITQRRAGDHLGGLWEFPGGKVEPGETFEECLQRELSEELGIIVSVGAELEEVAHAYPEKTVRLKFFACGLEAGTPQPIHCAALAWVTHRELRNYAFPASDARLLEKLENLPSLWA